MCGIAGVVQDATDGTDLVAEMCRRLAHRGPDSGGVQSFSRCALGATRLAIVDIDAGRQPMVSHDGKVGLVANAEIYNHRELRRELESHGHRFRTACDVEVILHGYERWGRGVVDRLNGMYAFAIWDERDERLLLARDPFGQKPLYYARAGQRLLFASEIAAIISVWGTRPEVDPAALASYLTLDFVPSPRSIFTGVSKVPPGHVLTSTRDGLRVARYWDLPETEPPRDSVDEASERVRALFDAAVARHLVADAPVGCFVSGGVDSSLVAERAAADGRGPLPSFCLGFDDPAHDESAYAERMGARLGASHQTVRFDAQAFVGAADRVADLLDEPLADPSLIAVEALSERARQRVKVVLGGDGADELLGGYNVFVAARLDDWTRGLGRARRLALEAFGRLGPAREQHFGADLLARQFAFGLTQRVSVRPLAFTATFRPEELQRLSPRAHHDPYVDLEADAAASSESTTRAALRLFPKIFLEGILAKVDRGSMAQGLELRSPFLDRDFVEYVAALPTSWKVRGLQRKWILRRALGPRIDRATWRRPKRGFSVPIVRWINDDLRGWFDDNLLDSSNFGDGWVERHEVERLLAAHRRRQLNARKPLWNLVTFFRWKRRWASPA